MSDTTIPPAVLSISSQVVRGHVGNSAAVFALHWWGIDVWPLPTVILSNHPGHGHGAKFPIDATHLQSMIQALREAGWLAQVSGVLTGYFATREQVEIAAKTIGWLKTANPACLYCCDPVLGDLPGGLYVDEPIAEAIRADLLPLADLATPNRFELEWLTGLGAASIDQAASAGAALGPAEVAITSLETSDDRLTTIVIERENLHQSVTHKIAFVPHGVGDLFAALYFGARLRGRAASEALPNSIAVVNRVLTASAGCDELNLAAGLAKEQQS